MNSFFTEHFRITASDVRIQALSYVQLFKDFCDIFRTIVFVDKFDNLDKLTDTRA